MPLTFQTPDLTLIAKYLNRTNAEPADHANILRIVDAIIRHTKGTANPHGQTPPTA